MKITFDRIARATYLRIGKGAVSTTRTIFSWLNVDLDAEGKVVGIELL